MDANQLLDIKSISQVLAGLIKNPNLVLRTDKYSFNQEDFGSDFYLYIYGAISNLKSMGAKTINLLDIDNYLSSRPNIYKTYIDKKGPEYLSDLVKSSDEDNFDYYYDRMKKMTLLRVYHKHGVDISWLYNPSDLDVKKKQLQEDWLDMTDITSIADEIDDKINKIRSELLVNASGKGVKAGENIFDLIHRLKETPEVGIPLYGNLINTITRGARLKKFYLRSAATGLGKALKNGTLVATPDGFIPIEKLTVGQPIFGEDGKSYRVKGVFPQGEKDVVEIKFSNGAKVECCEDHLWTYSKAGGAQYTKDTKTIMETENIARGTTGTVGKLRLPAIRPLRYTRKALPITPYSMGVILSDAVFRNNGYHTYLSLYDEEILEKVNAALKEVNATLSQIHYKETPDRMFFNIRQIKRERTSRFLDIIKDLGLLKNHSTERFIPEIYKQSSPRDRWDLLKGIIDSKGGLTSEHNGYIYTTPSAQFAKDIKEVADSLGLITRIRISTKGYLKEDGTKDYKPDGYYDLIIRTNQFLKTVHDSKRIEERWKKPADYSFVSILEINKKDEKAEMTCISTTNPTELFILDGGIVTHNTRMSIADAAYIACDEIYSIELNKWIKNGVKEPALFISTEQEVEELQTMLLAFLSGVNEDNILNGRYTNDEEQRVMKAAQLLSEAPLFLEELPDFSLADIENTIRKHVIDNGVKYIFMDYIHTSLKILEEITKKTGGMRLREDNILFMLAIRLKDLCNQYGVFIMSATQLNGEWESKQDGNQNLLRGAKSIADKIDFGTIVLPVTETDLKNLASLLTNSAVPTPDLVHHIYKNRRGRYKSVKLWCKQDLGTCRVNPLFLTDNSYKLIPLENFNIEVEDD